MANFEEGETKGHHRLISRHSKKNHNHSQKKGAQQNYIGGYQDIYQPTIDREISPPVLIPIYYAVDSQLGPQHFEAYDKFPKNRFEIYGWPDLTLREVLHLAKNEKPEIFSWGATIHFTALTATPQTGTSTKQGALQISWKHYGHCDAFLQKMWDTRSRLSSWGFAPGDILVLSIETMSAEKE